MNRDILKDEQEIKDEDLLKIVPEFTEKDRETNVKDVLKNDRRNVHTFVFEEKTPGFEDPERGVLYTRAAEDGKEEILGISGIEAYEEFFGEKAEETVEKAFASEKDRVISLYNKAKAINMGLMDISETQVTNEDLIDVYDGRNKVAIYMDGMDTWFEGMPLSFESADMLDETLEDIISEEERVGFLSFNQDYEEEDELEYEHRFGE